MFWRFGGYANISTLDTILDKPDVTLEELLDESDLIQEVKAQNAKLIEFLRNESILQRLLKYVLASKVPFSRAGSQSPPPPKEEENKSGGLFFKSRASKARPKSFDATDADQEKQENKRQKYAFVACEILSSEVYSIYESILENEDHLREFWQFIKRQSPLDATQAGYFTKVNEALLEKKTDDMITFMKTLDNVIPDMMKHVDCPMVMDLLLKLISLEKETDGQGVVDWLQSQDMIPQLLNYITPEYPASIQTSAGDFLKAIITISANATGTDASVIGPNELTRQLVSKECVDGLIVEMLRGGNPLTVGVGIIIEVIRKNNSDYDSETQIGPEPKSSDPIYLGTLLHSFSRHIPDFMNLLHSTKHTVISEKGVMAVQERQELKVAWGERIEPLGFDRFKTCELMAELLHCSNMGLLNEKGSDAAVQARDAERERLKAEGKLSSAMHSQPSQADFTGSLDNSGFHHADTFTPLGESPEDIKRLEVQNIADDDGFEKVAMSDAFPESADHNEDLAGVSRGGKRDSSSNALAGQGSKDDVDTDSNDLNDQMSKVDLASQPRKRTFSLLTQQLQAAKKATAGLSNYFFLDSAGHPDDKPAPLFASRNSPSIQNGEFQPAENNTQLHDGSLETPSETHGSEDDGSSRISESTSVLERQDQQNQNLPVIETEDDGSPVVGDYLKMQFVQDCVVPTIIDFFFRFPWNNFLHNVVYDVVQQVFNGAMDRGFNRNLAIDLFETGRITERIIEGQRRSDHSQAENLRRLGYMGHLTLIAEEVVKFTERQPAELLAPSVVGKVTDPDWIHYVEHVLTETRDRDNAILGGVRPDASGGPRQAVLNAVNASQNSGLGGAAGSAALANAGLGGGAGAPQGLDTMDLAGAAGTSAYSITNSSLLSGFGSSDDEDEDDMEEAELAEDVVGGLAQLGIDDEEQLEDPIQESSSLENPTSSTKPTSATEAATGGRGPLSLETTTLDTASTDPTSPHKSDDKSPSAVPAPLAIPPSRARIQLAARLAEKEKKRRADEATAAGDDSPSASTNPKQRPSKPTKASPPSDDGEDDEDSPSDGSDEDPKTKQGIKRQMTREASHDERRPLDIGSDDDDSDEDGDASIAARAGVPVGTGAEGGKSDKQREQERLLEQWGLSGGGAGVEKGKEKQGGRSVWFSHDEEEEDDDDDDEADDGNDRLDMKKSTGTDAGAGAGASAASSKAKAHKRGKSFG